MPDLYAHETPDYLHELAYQLRRDGQTLDAIAAEFDIDRREAAAWITAHAARLDARAAHQQPSLFD